MPSITTREYHPESGALLSNITTIKFGRVTAGTHSRVKVIDVAFGDVSVVGNVKIGLISNAGISINESPEDIGTDGSSSNGSFGVEDTTSFDSGKAASPLTRHFPGLNGTGTSTDDNNVSIGTRSATLSNYIYFDVEVGASLSGAGNGAYKIFFDYS